MSAPSLYDDKALAHLTRIQKEREWDLEQSIHWDIGVDLSKPLVPLDERAIIFPGAGKEERLVISQVMGLIIADCICEMEECLLRFRKECWEDHLARNPVSPELKGLAEQFFVEEQKHSSAFRRYLEKFAEATNIDLDTLISILPTIKDSKTEFILKQNMKAGGLAFWWIVASVEQEFLLLYRSMAPFSKELDPLYYVLHQKHFEEEARHAPFPYLALELLATRDTNWLRPLHVKADLMAAQAMQTLWTFSSLAKLRNVKKLAGAHPIFDAMIAVFPKLEEQPIQRVIFQLLTSAPYVSSLVNPASHQKLLRFAKKLGAFSFPHPFYTPADLVKY